MPTSIFLYIFTYMFIPLVLFLIGILGFVLNKKSIILMIIHFHDNILGQIYATYIIAIAGAESAIGLYILVLLCRLRGNIAIEFK